MKYLLKQLNNSIKELKQTAKAHKKIYDNSSKNNFLMLTGNYRFLKSMLLKSDFNGFSEKTSAAADEILRNNFLQNTEKTEEVILKLRLSTKEIKQLPDNIRLKLFLLSCRNSNKNDSFQAAIKDIYKLDNTDFAKILSDTSTAHAILSNDPTGEYTKMSEETKDAYRNAVISMAERFNKSEAEIAAHALENAQKDKKHIGFYLDFQNPDKKKSSTVLALEPLIPFAVSLSASLLLSSPVILPLSFLPLWECTKFITSIITSKISKPKALFSMDCNSSVPENEKAVIAVSVLIPNHNEANEWEKTLSKLYISSSDEIKCICLLADPKPANTPISPADEENLNALIKLTDSLNEKYSDSFVLAVRSRRYSVTQGEYCAHERKRGAVTELVKFICTGEHTFAFLKGNTSKLKNAKYVMALDSDTQIGTESLKRLIKIASHPLNRPVFSENGKTVTDGYGIIAPKTENSLTQKIKTNFSLLFAGCGGVPAYSAVSGEKYQQLFGQSIFCGKGLIDTHAFYSLLTDSFPQEQILSHDILEGIVLRTAFAGNVTVTDNFPLSEKSYFKRLHRWVRGDVQNLALLFDKCCSKLISPLGKVWLLDNIRREITPIAALAAVCISAFTDKYSGKFLLCTGILSAFLPHFISFLSTLSVFGQGNILRVFFGNSVPHAMRCLLLGLAEIMLLPAEAVNNLDAVFRSFYRLTISRKKLLEWVTAADSEAFSLLPFSPFSVVFGLLFIFTLKPLQMLTGTVFLLEIPFSFILSKREKELQTKAPSAEESLKIKEYCKSMWHFYEDYCNAENNYLIPDNIAEEPCFKEAERTSPTNLGLMLTSFLAARDFGFINSRELYIKLDKSLTAIEKTEKYKGNLYNWYSIKTLKILKPVFVSSVDSGNFLCSLVTLKEGICEYEHEEPMLKDIKERAQRLINDCDLGFMYSKSKKLFHVGFDVEKQKLSDSYYDLLMSEARMASYFAVSYGHAPVSHWEALGRPLGRNGNRYGSLAWSGTMFEYLMPSLFLPDVKNSLSFESVNFCIYSQKKRAKKLKIPFGVSESCYYKFDEKQNYLYTANGIKKIAANPDCTARDVISPYSTFLALEYDVTDCVKNLNRLKSMGAAGKYGFYEAVDFSDRKNPETVKSYMSHHIGMSMTGSANCIFDGCMKKRFMQDKKTASKASLLEEKPL